MKKLLLLLFSLVSFFSFAQLDREHWFAPMVDRTGNANNYQSIYMSTGESTPFKVEVYYNNAVVYTTMISKNNPGRYIIQNSERNRIITTSPSDMFKPVSMGFYLKGDKPFFSSLRFSVKNHGEIQTSKGTAGLGTEFRAVMAPITSQNGILNFMNSIMATEDNTSVTIDGFQPNVVFSDFVNRTQITFTLNKGQSYIIDGSGSYTLNHQGYIGAKIVSDKPIVISNGNFNGQYAGNHSLSSDILMDQGVPVDRLGTDFVLMKGNGTTSSGMESAMIVATQNNTQVFINGSPTPAATLNAGQFYITDNSAYILQGGSHYNMYVKTSQNAYVYQLLAGDAGSSMVATGGFNYIPPLSCYLPKKIDEIGKIDENEFISNNIPYSLTVPTKFNIITEKGATVDVKRNGVSLPITAGVNGPFNVTGNPNWVTYSFPNISGNVAVFSSHAVTAGISAGNDAVGYGGYFAGFSFIPAIIKVEGDCLPGVKLAVTEGFNSYLWLIKQSDGTYLPAPGINNTFEYTPTQAGIYSVKIQQGSCPEIQTGDFKFYNCTTYTNTDYNICTTTVINPTFALSTQNISPTTVKIDTPPTKGMATVDNLTGAITYTANLNATGTDTFKYSFKGNGTIPDSESAQATIHLNQINYSDQILYACSATGTAVYDLTSAAVTTETSTTKTYYSDAALTNQIPTAQLTNYTSAAGIVYVKLENAFPCTALAKIELKIKAPPVVNPALYTQTHCDEDIDGIIDGIYKVDLATITPIVLQNPTAFTATYYTTQAFANADGTNNITGIHSFSATTNSVWIRVLSPDTCAPVVMEIPLIIGPKVAITTPKSKNVCDDGLDNTENINLDTYKSLFTSDGTVTVKYFASLADAQNNTPTIAAVQTITGDKIFYYRFSKAGFCDEIGILNLIFKQASPSTMLPATVPVCQGGTTSLNIGSGYTSILWSTGATGSSITVGAGTYTVSFTNSDGCAYLQTVTVVESPKPVWNLTAITITNCDDNFDGIIPVDLSTITPILLSNSNLLTVEYFADAALTIPLPNNWSYSTNTSIWVRATSAHCPTEVKKIDFKLGTNLPLNSIVTKHVCDNDLNNEENVNLANYLIDFTTDTSVSVKYFDNLTKAQNNIPGEDIPALQNINANKTFYLRFSKNGFCDAMGALNLLFKQPTSSATLPSSVPVCEGDTTIVNAGTGFTIISWSNGTSGQTAIYGAGTHWVNLTNSTGCTFHQIFTVVESPKPIWNPAAFTITNCDDNFDGIIPVDLSTITPQILNNSSLFIVEYFADAALTVPLLNNWSYSTNTSIWVRATSPHCPAEVQKLDFKLGNSLTFINGSTQQEEICGNDLNGIENINLANYHGYFMTDPSVSVKYFDDLIRAQNNISGQDIPASQDISGNKTFYLRFSKANFCDVIGTLNVIFKQPKKSLLLKDIEQTCPRTIKHLDAGSGFTSYLWSTGATTPSIDIPVGDYWVDLGFNGCTYRQYVKVTPFEMPVITRVDIQGSTVTVIVTGGNPPYQYSLDGGAYQTSNVFNNVRGGDHTINVISADNCDPVSIQINVIEIYNVITPNADGINDSLNFSGLQKKDEPYLQIFDRYGSLVFTGEKNNLYTWDGKSAGKIVPTGSYWYVIRWREPGATSVTQYSGWILVKNR